MPLTHLTESPCVCSCVRFQFPPLCPRLCAACVHLFWMCYIIVKQAAEFFLWSSSPTLSHWPQLCKIFILLPAPQHSVLHIYEAGCRPPVLDGSASSFFLLRFSSPLLEDLCKVYYTVAKGATVILNTPTHKD